MNSGNYGLPVSQLIFSHNPVGVSIQIFIVIFQNLLTYSYGIYNLLSATKTIGSIIQSFLRLPVFHALILGVLFQSFTIQIPNSIFLPLNQLANSFVAIALILLGAQLSNIKLNFFHRVITWALIGRLLMGPLLALAMIYLLNIDGIVAQSLFIASSFPTSRNTATIAMEYQIEPELHAQIVLFSNTFQHYYSNCRYLFVIYFVLNIRAKTDRLEAVNDGRKSHRYEKKTVFDILGVRLQLYHV